MTTEPQWSPEKHADDMEKLFHECMWCCANNPSTSARTNAMVHVTVVRALERVYGADDPSVIRAKEEASVHYRRPLRQDDDDDDVRPLARFEEVE